MCIALAVTQCLSYSQKILFSSSTDRVGTLRTLPASRKDYGLENVIFIGRESDYFESSLYSAEMNTQR